MNVNVLFHLQSIPICKLGTPILKFQKVYKLVNGVFYFVKGIFFLQIKQYIVSRFVKR